MGLSKIRNARLTDKVAEALYNEIAKGTFKSGDKLPTEAEMSEQLGVARPTVREAISRLIGLGLVERGDYGVYVADSVQPVIQAALVPMLLNEWKIRELYEARVLVECNLVSLACQKVTAEDIAELTSINEKLNTSELSAADYFKFDMEFHHQLAKISGNAVMESISNTINDMFNRYEKVVMKMHAIQDSTYLDHKALIEAIEAKDITKAHAIVVRALSSSEHAMYELRKREPHS